MSKQAQQADTENLTLVQAVRDGLQSEMRNDDDVLVMGEDVGKNGGVFRATEASTRSSARTASSTRRWRKPGSSVPPSGWRRTG